MAIGEELKKIKRLYGEETMKLCRERFPTILESEGMLLHLLTKSFATNARKLAQDIKEQEKEEDFVNFIYAQYDQIKNPEKYRAKSDKSPYEVLKDAGYTLYEATSEDEIQSYKKYYAFGEELCTFEGRRLNRCFCFWAIKDDVDNIKRDDYTFPKREDQYSTSVLAIQFPRSGRCEVSIKSRYNHAVINPDATYGNDLDQVAPGLYESFKKFLYERGCELNKSSSEPFELDGYTFGPDGKHYKVNIFANDVAYCPGNVVVAYNYIKQFENTEQQILMDKFVLDLKEKTLVMYGPGKYVTEDSFVDAFKNIEKIERHKDKKTGETKLTINIEEGKYPIHIVLDDLNNIIEYENENLEEIGRSFLGGNDKLRRLIIPNVKKIGGHFLGSNRVLEEIDMSKVEEIGVSALFYNERLKNISLPNLEVVGQSFLNCNHELISLDVPKLKIAGDYFLYNSGKLTTLNAPNLEEVGRYCLAFNENLENLDLPNIRKIGDSFLMQNRAMQNINMPKVEQIDNNFMINNNSLETISFPKLKTVGNLFLRRNEVLKEARFDELVEVGDSFISNCETLETFEAPKLNRATRLFLSSSTKFCNYISNRDITILDRQSKVTKKEINEVDELFRDLDDIEPDIYKDMEI